ncbi:MAG TPA: hypothetical protein VGW38_14620, partial [Chloroflexota bacterium]|nr:hypothetical protein [Chloroflexota bacterium]
MTDWRPLYVRENPEVEEAYSALVQGVPEHLRWSLWRWIQAAVASSSGGGYHHLKEPILRKMERALRFSIGWNGDNSLNGHD